MQALNVVENPSFESAKANKLQVVKTDQLTVDALYLKAGQEHGPLRLPAKDRFIVGLSGSGYVLLMTQPVEQRIALKTGVVALAPRGIFHLIKAETDLVVAVGSQFPAQVEEIG